MTPFLWPGRPIEQHQGLSHPSPAGQRGAPSPLGKRCVSLPAVLTVLGTLLVATSFGLLTAPLAGQWLHRQAHAAAASEPLPARFVEPAPATPISLASVPAPLAEPASTAPTPVESGAVPSEDSTAQRPRVPGQPELPPPIDYGEPVWVSIPRIGLNTSITRVGIQHGAYVVPAWDIGWQEDSSHIGLPGNTVFNGHLETIDAGRVFARLHQLQPGDAIYVYTADFRTDWVVVSSERVPGDDWSFMAPTDDVRLTLYTCEGTFDWAARRYSHYRVVTARLLEAAERG